MRCVVGIVDAKSGAIVVPEFKLGKVAVKVLLGAVLVDAAHPALDDGEVELDGVAVNLAPDVLAGGMVDGLEGGKAPAHGGVKPAFP